jgi:hypothetical protein
MDRITALNPGRIAIMALYVVGAWASLAGLMFALTWAPQETWGESARVIAIIAAAVALVMCVIGATARLLASAAASVPDPGPRP